MKTCKVFKRFISTKIIYSGQKTRGLKNRKGLGKRYALIIVLGYFKHVMYFNILVYIQRRRIQGPVKYEDEAFSEIVNDLDVLTQEPMTERINPPGK